MDILPLLAPLSGIAACLSLLWLSARAFRKHIGWGFLVLLLSPVGASIFGITHWSEEKRPFLAYITTFTLSLSLALYLFTSWGGWEMVKAGYRVQLGIESQNLSEEDATAFVHTSMNFIEKSGLEPINPPQLDSARAHLDKLETERLAAVEPEPTTGDDTAPGVEGETASTGDDLTREMISKKAEPQQERYRLEFMTISTDDASKYIGYTVKVTRKGDLEKEYRLTGASGGRLRLFQRNNHGSYSFSYNIRDIEKLRVLTRQPTEPRT